MGPAVGECSLIVLVAVGDCPFPGAVAIRPSEHQGAIFDSWIIQYYGWGHGLGGTHGEGRERRRLDRSPLNLSITEGRMGGKEAYVKAQSSKLEA